MEQFAIIGGQDQGYRYIKDHPLLRLLPIKWAESMIPTTKARFTEPIYTRDGQNKLGYILYVPGFFVEQDKLTDLDRTKILNNLIDVLMSRDIGILVFPLWRKFLSIEEKNYLEENAIMLLDGGLIRLVSLMDTVERLLATLKAKPHELEVGIWGVDHIVGQLWAEFLSPRLNNLVIGGYDVKILEELSDKILYDTGLSCQITTNPNQCLDKKSMAILCSIPEGWDNLGHSRITILSYYDLGYEELMDGNHNSKSIFIESGLPSIPKKLKVSNLLDPWDEIGALEASLFIMDEPFRNLLLNSSLNMENMDKLKEILMKYEASSVGMISNNEILSYNGFRKLYFGNFLDKANGSIL